MSEVLLIAHRPKMAALFWGSSTRLAALNDTVPEGTPLSPTVPPPDITTRLKPSPTSTTT
ncbi:MAG: hypothetical protein QM736_06645 [Vicinamibacterales bacterium]